MRSNNPDWIEFTAWWACSASLVIAGFAVGIGLFMPWFGVSAGCVAGLLFWGSMEMKDALDADNGGGE